VNTLYRGAYDFIHTHVEEVLEKYDRWLEEREQNEKRWGKQDEKFEEGYYVFSENI